MFRGPSSCSLIAEVIVKAKSGLLGLLILSSILSAHCGNEVDVKVRIVDPLNKGQGIEQVVISGQPFLPEGNTESTLTATTDMNGQALLESMKRGTSYKVFGAREGFTGATLEGYTVPDDGDPQPITLSMSPVCRLVGKVYDALSENPVPDASVVATTKSDIIDFKSFLEIETRTDDQGTFVIETIIPNQKYRLTISKEGYSSNSLRTKSPASGQSRELKKSTIQPLPKLVGSVKHALSKRAVSECEVRIDDLGMSTKTNEDGEFSFRGVPIGKNRIQVLCGSESGFSTIRVKLGKSDIKLSKPILVLSESPSPTGLWVVEGEERTPIMHSVDFPRGFEADIERSTRRLWDGCAGIRKCKGFFYERGLNNYRIEKGFVTRNQSKTTTIRKGQKLLSLPTKNGNLMAIPLVWYGSERYPCRYRDCSGGWKSFVLQEGYYAGMVKVKGGWTRNRYGVPEFDVSADIRSFQLGSGRRLVVRGSKYRIDKMSLSPGYYCFVRDRDTRLNSRNSCVLVRVK